jgi:ketosteroid isomerase-like protein
MPTVAPLQPKSGELVGLAAGAALLALVAGCRTTSEAPLPAWQAAILAKNSELEREFAAGNLLGVADVYADDAEIVDGHGERTRGRAAIDAYWSAIEEPLEWRLENQRLRGSEVLAYQLGTSRLSVRRAGATETFVSDFLIVWRHDPDGAWRIEYDAYWPSAADGR